MTADHPRIALLTPHPFGGYRGGTEVFNGLLQRALGDVEVFADPEGLESARKGPLTRVGLSEPYGAMGVARAFLRHHRVNPFQLAICNGLYGWPLTFGHLGIPLVEVYHFTMAGLARQALPLRGDRFTTGTVAAFFDGLAGRGKFVVAVSDSVRREVRDYYGFRGQVIPNAVDPAFFRRRDRQQARERLGLPDQSPIGLFVGRPEYAKGFDVFLEVARSRPDITFVVLGTGTATEQNVRMLGDVPHAEMPLFYSASDFLFLPSRYEGFSLIVLEAAACELPLVVSRAAYNLAANPSDLGFVAESLRPEEFQKGIQLVLDQRSTFSPREAIADMYAYERFRQSWNGLVTTLLQKTQG
ncbi:MAG: glycosyltransferase family 4 protein [Acidobacteriota bacterium]